MQAVIWYKSRESNPSGNCVLFKTVDGVIYLGDDKVAGQPELPFAMDSWRGGRAVRFIAVHKSAIPATHLALSPDAPAWYRVTKNGVSLFFDQAEKDAFIAAIDEQRWVPALVGA